MAESQSGGPPIHIAALIADSYRERAKLLRKVRRDPNDLDAARLDQAADEMFALPV